MTQGRVANPHFTEEDKLKVVNEYITAHANNMTRQQVCDKNKVHISTVVKWVRQLGFATELHNQGKRPNPDTPARPVEKPKRGARPGQVRTMYPARLKLQVLDAWRNRQQTGKSLSQILTEFGINGHTNSAIYQWASVEKHLKEIAKKEESNGQALITQNENGLEGQYIDIDPSSVPRRGRPVTVKKEWLPSDIPLEVTTLVGQLMIENVHLKRFGRRQ
jgi:transposase-like protein